MRAATTNSLVRIWMNGMQPPGGSVAGRVRLPPAMGILQRGAASPGPIGRDNVHESRAT